jgi:preprotein translocase subunit YajC
LARRRSRMAKELDGWQMQKTADELKPGDKIIFAENLGGEGEVLTVESTASSFGTVEVATEEKDFTIELNYNTWVNIDLTEDEDENPATPEPLWPLPQDSEYIERREKLAEFLCNLVYGNGAWGEAEKSTQLNYRLDADDIIKTNPHLLSLAERERLADTIPELKAEA